MHYTQIKITYPHFEKRFYRILAVKEDMNLVLLGAVIAKNLGAWFEHVYTFETKDKEYVPETWLDEPTSLKTALPMSQYTFKDLPDSFHFIYDTGEDWNFFCKKMKKTIEYHTDDINQPMPIAFLVEGKGAGIFENDRWTLDRYLNGEINPELDGDDEENDIYFPMNLDLDTFKDFDGPLDTDDDTYEYFGWQFDDVLDDYNTENSTNLPTNARDYVDDDWDDDFDQNDHDAQKAMYMASALIALDIFTQEDVNREFRRLIKTHDINEAFEMIHDVVIDLMMNTDPDMDQEEMDALRIKAIKALK